MGLIMNENIVQSLQLDLNMAKSNHNSQIAIIENWRAEYDGDAYTTKASTDTYAGLVSKLIRKTVESATPSLVEPFLGNKIVNAQGRDSESDRKAKAASEVLNYYWSYGINPEKFIEPLVRNLQVDGTVVCKVIWKDGKPNTVEVPVDSVMFDPTAKSMDESRFVIEQSKVSIGDILSGASCVNVVGSVL